RVGFLETRDFSRVIGWDDAHQQIGCKNFTSAAIKQVCLCGPVHSGFIGGGKNIRGSTRFKVLYQGRRTREIEIYRDMRMLSSERFGDFSKRFLQRGGCQHVQRNLWVPGIGLLRSGGARA